jgi:hypothetical protein
VGVWMQCDVFYSQGREWESALARYGCGVCDIDRKGSVSCRDKRVAIRSSHGAAWWVCAMR